MAINRKVITVSVDIKDGSIDYNAVLKAAWDSAAGSGDYKIAYVEKRAAATNKETYIVWLEETV